MKKKLILGIFFLSTLAFGQTQAEKDLLWGMSGVWISDETSETIVVDLVNQKKKKIEQEIEQEIGQGIEQARKKFFKEHPEEIIKLEMVKLIKWIGHVEIKIKEINVNKKFVIFLIGDSGFESVIKLDYEIDRLTDRTVKKLIVRFGNKQENIFSLVKDFNQLQNEQRRAEEQRKQNEIEQRKAEELRIIEQKKVEELELKKEEEIKLRKEEEENEKKLSKEKEFNERSKAAEEAFLSGFSNNEHARNSADKISIKNIEIEALLKNGMTILIDQDHSEDESLIELDQVFFGEPLFRNSGWKLKVKTNDIYSRASGVRSQL